MLELVQLADGTYRLTVKFHDQDANLESTWYFNIADPSEAEVVKRVFAMTIQK